jgi:hypothetical protein
VHDEVDRQGAGHGVGVDHGVGAHGRPLALGQQLRVAEDQLHVAVGVVAADEGRQVVAAEVDPDHAGAELLVRGDGQGGDRLGHVAEPS